jgi:hypothetical protein
MTSRSESIRPARPQRRYCLITPCRNEAAFIRRTLETTTAQTVPPARWVIVDDGSTDDTPEILAEYAQRFEYIRVVTREDRGQRAVGPGVIEAFYEGLSTVDLDDYDYVCKFDGDLEMPPRYFERVMEAMEADPYLGNFSGKLFERKPDGSLFEERTGDENAVGPVKFYRVRCFREIGGFVREVMWDGIDCHRCRMKGWIACSWDDPELRFVHLRPMGSSQQSIYVGRMRHGAGQYFMGTGLLYMAASAASRLNQKPYVLGAAAMLWGWLASALQGKPRLEDPQFRRALRAYQRRTLLTGKKGHAWRTRT